LGYDEAAATIFGLMQGARRLGLTGVVLKEEGSSVVSIRLRRTSGLRPSA
jgi:hypothetical protein